jgi:hypothetical protein
MPIHLYNRQQDTVNTVDNRPQFTVYVLIGIFDDNEQYEIFKLDLLDPKS